MAMLLLIKKLVSAVLLPPFINIFLIILSIIIYYQGFKKTAKILFSSTIVSLYLLSTPIVANNLLASLHESYNANNFDDAQAIVVLGGGVRKSDLAKTQLSVAALSLERMRLAALLEKNTHLPILVTGGSIAAENSEAQIMAKEFLLLFNIQVKWIEPKAKDTKENALYSRELLDKAKINNILLVTQAWHMRRARLEFEKLGFKVYPAPVFYQFDYTYGPFRYIPQVRSLHNSTIALKEWMGILYAKFIASLKIISN